AGSAALGDLRGRPQSLRPGELATARAARTAGESDRAIGRRLGVHATTVARALARAGGASVEAAPVALQEPLSEAQTAGSETAGVAVMAFRGSARVAAGVVRSRYGGAMLLYPFLDRVGAETIFATLTGAAARRYDDVVVLTAATLGFALGIDTVEGSKHLRRVDAGAAVGAKTIPELSTLRARLGALGDGCDPLALQRSFAAGMVAFDPADDPVYFVDDHFVAYSGARPVAKGWNTRRRHAEPGRDDTLLTDARGRAVVFSSAEPTGLSSTLPGVLAQLRAVIGAQAKVLLGFDRGGAYPIAFRACRDVGADWVTYRRAPLVDASATPRRSWTVRDGKRITVTLADELVTINGYGTARQLTLYEHGRAVLQVLTSDLTATGAYLLCWLRSRWRIENVFKYASAHNGIDSLAAYSMDIGPDTRLVANPARAAARKAVAAAEVALAAAERALPQLLAGPGTVAHINALLPKAHRRIEAATAELTAAKTALRPIPAKIAATDIDPDAQRARQRIERRGLQMVLRLLAFNAEAWTAEHFNAYLADPDEHRAILRNLLHLGATINYDTTTTTVTLDRPDSPRVARSLALLADELTALAAHLPGDRRPISYQVADTPVSTPTQTQPTEV
ncbi:MAG: putative transposase, partial [Acidimicrobiales bacterium]